MYLMLQFHSVVCFYVIPFLAMMASAEFGWIKNRDQVFPIEEVAAVVTATVVINLLALLWGSTGRMSTVCICIIVSHFPKCLILCLYMQILTGMVIQVISFAIVIGSSVQDKTLERVHDIFMG